MGASWVSAQRGRFQSPYANGNLLNWLNGIRIRCPSGATTNAAPATPSADHPQHLQTVTDETPRSLRNQWQNLLAVRFTSARNLSNFRQGSSFRPQG